MKHKGSSIVIGCFVFICLFVGLGVVAIERSVAYGFLDLDAITSMFSTMYESHNDCHSYLCEAKKYSNNKEYDKAIKYCNKAIKLESDFGPAYGVRASCYAHLGDDDRAIEDCNMAITVSPALSYSYSLRARLLFQRGDYTNALSDCSKAIELAPWESYSYGLRGWIYSQQGEGDKALVDLSKVIEMEPKIYKYYIWRAKVYTNQEQYDEAIADIETTRLLGCKVEYMDLMIANIEIKKGNLQKALERFDAALLVSPESAELLNSKAYLLCTALDAKYRNGAEALRLGKLALKYSTEYNSCNIMDTVACAYAELGQFENAVSIQKKAIKMREGDVELKKHLDFFEAGKPWRE